MQVLKTISELRMWRASARTPVGFVPTMGYLHTGHLSLVRRARAETATVTVSIFVNPTQFGPHEDFRTYPRDLARDLQLLQPEGVDAVFVPEVEEIYAAGASTVVNVERLSTMLEGATRPGHFQGVATIVSKLFHLVEPQRAYFGEKDFQQLRLIQQMARDLNMAIEVIGCPTVREPDGLAMSSRNIYLSPEERMAACALPRGLFQAQVHAREGEHDALKLAALVREMLEREPLARIDYVAVVHPATLQPLEMVGPEGATLCIAVWIGKTRLIDNISLTPSPLSSPPMEERGG